MGNSFPVVSRSAKPPANQCRPAGTKQYADPCKSIKALISTNALLTTKVLTHPQSLSRFHRPQRGKSTCARKVRNAVTDLSCVKTGVSREGEVPLSRFVYPFCRGTFAIRGSARASPWPREAGTTGPNAANGRCGRKDFVVFLLKNRKVRINAW
jgi:hypothetical protein